MGKKEVRRQWAILAIGPIRPIRAVAQPKAQVSLEYLLIMGFALVITLPLIVFFFSNATGLNERVTFHQAERVARDVVAAAEKVYFVGEPARTTLKVNMPDNIVDVRIEGREFLLRARVSDADADIYEVSDVNLTGNISHTMGVKYVLIKAGDQVVTVTEAAGG